ncbi:hypothetical protein U1Q18_051761, partial [Sarracenia purpurea var. burkii]
HLWLADDLDLRRRSLWFVNPGISSIAVAAGLDTPFVFRHSSEPLVSAFALVRRSVSLRELLVDIVFLVLRPCLLGSLNPWVFTTSA